MTLARNDPRHGTENGYINLKCRCARCTRAHAEYHAWRMEARAIALGPCEADGCDRGQYARGLCKAHYWRLLNGVSFDRPIQTATVQDGLLRCAVCQEWLPDACFAHNRSDVYRRFRHTNCRECNNVARQEYRDRNRVPCEGCGTLVEGKGRPNSRSDGNGGRVQLDPARPYLCRSCALVRHNAKVAA